MKRKENKIMTQEEKAKRYDEAIERAKEILETRCKEGEQGAFHRKDLQDIFSELAESEDEKVRKDIISLVDEFWAKIGSIHPEFTTHDKMIAWLEKQKPAEKVEQKFNVGDKIRKKVPVHLIKIWKWQELKKTTMYVIISE